MGACFGVFLKNRNHKLKKKITETWFREAYDHGFSMGRCNVFFGKFEKVMGKNDANSIYKELNINKNEDWFGNPEKKRNKKNNRNNHNGKNSMKSKHKNNSTGSRNICKNFKRGNCKFGNRCRYLHGEVEERKTGA